MARKRNTFVSLLFLLVQRLYFYTYLIKCVVLLKSYIRGFDLWFHDPDECVRAQCNARITLKFTLQIIIQHNFNLLSAIFKCDFNLFKFNFTFFSYFTIVVGDITWDEFKFLIFGIWNTHFREKVLVWRNRVIKY